MDTVRIKINGFEFPARADASILEASRESYGAKQWDIKIPTLGYLKGIQEVDDSGACIVEDAVTGDIYNASATKVWPGMSVLTRSDAVMAAQGTVVAQIMTVHDQDCARCFRTGNCELQTLVNRQMYVSDPATKLKKTSAVDRTAIVVRDANKCIRCGRCVAVCEKIQGVGAIERVGGGFEAIVGPKGGGSLASTDCVSCGQCIAACPVGALRERDDTDRVLEAIVDPEKFVVVQAAPSVRAGLGEEFGFPVGSEVEGRLAAALRRLGFDRVFDTKLGADLTIMEEATEFIARLKSGDDLPIATSCCPAWVRHCEIAHPGFLGNLSSCKSPQQMMGAVIKTYLAEKEGIVPERIVVVSVMPCTAKKFEITRPDEDAAGVPDVDISITTRELAAMIRRKGVKFESLAPEPFDNPFGEGTGAGVIFGATGGVMEAALRTAADWLSGEELSPASYDEVRGLSGVREAAYSIAGRAVRVAVANGLAQADALVASIERGEASYDFIEVMACPGGCVNGGGQPQQVAEVSALHDLRRERARALYNLDEGAKVRKSHENPLVAELYSSFVGEAGGPRAHELFHTHYEPRLAPEGE